MGTAFGIRKSDFYHCDAIAETQLFKQKSILQYNLPFKVDLHNNLGKISRIVLDSITFIFLCHGRLCDCQTGTQGVEMILDRAVEVTKCMMMLKHPVWQGTLLFMIVNLF